MTRLALLALLASLFCVVAATSSVIDASHNSIEVLNSDAILKGKVGCTFCKLLAGVARKAFESKPSFECLSWIAAEMCTLLRIEDAHVCRGSVKQYRRDLAYVATKTILSDNDICGMALKVCPYTPKDTNWTIPLDDKKPPVKPWSVQPPGKPTLTVLHLSDIHIEPAYRLGAEAMCGEPMCCSSHSPNAGHRNTVKYASGKWGMGVGFACDLPLITVENAMQSIADTHKEIDLILWTGDINSHNAWNFTKKQNLRLIETVTELYLKYFPGVTVVSAIGNHEGVPCNDIPDRTVPDNLSHDWLYDALEKSWGNWLPKDTSVSIKWRASFVHQAKKNLRIISLNTIYGYTMNFFLLANDKDPDGTLSWMVEQLSEAEKLGQKVWIIGHIPSGTHDARKAWSRNFYLITNRYESTIRGQFYGHTHKDEFAVFYDDYVESSGEKRQTPTSFYFVTPSLTTITDLVGSNPAYRIYTTQGEYDGSDYSVIDADTYSMDVDSANLPGHSPVWTHEYSTRKAYNMSTLHPSDWDMLIKKLSTDSTLMDEFYKFLHRTVDSSNCDAACRQKRICQLGNAYSAIKCDAKTEQAADFSISERQLTEMMVNVGEFERRVRRTGICRL